uniref:Uncharacterized protein n=1 Tax=Kalanchoe fedtschenkoi TaxID=63787 RepID=A0A7N0ZWZ3_KALFE
MLRLRLPLSRRSRRRFQPRMQCLLVRWAKNVSEASRKAEVLAGNTWQHLNTSPSFADAAIGRIAQGTKVLAEGGYEKIFPQTFETEPDEKYVNSFVCDLSTSAGPSDASCLCFNAKACSLQ